jgi:hypothetical protein
MASFINTEDSDDEIPEKDLLLWIEPFTFKPFSVSNPMHDESSSELESDRKEYM